MRGMEKRRGSLRAMLLTFCLVLAVGSPGMMAFGALPDSLSLTAGSQAYLPVALPVRASLNGENLAQLDRDAGGLAVQAGKQAGSGSLVLRLLGVLPVKEIELEVEEERMLIPGGQPVGIAIETQGLIVVGMSDLGTTASPARVAGLKSGDLIVQIDGQAVQDPNDLATLLRPGVAADVIVMRKGSERSFELTPVTDPRDGALRIGAWVRSSTAGVGTLTYIDPETGGFGALGHAIADVDTGVTMPVSEGGLYDSGIAQIVRGQEGRPGEIVGDFLIEPELIGEITKNSDHGVFGENYAGARGRPMPVAARSEVHEGACEILSAVDGTLKSYACEIEEINWNAPGGMRALTLRVTDADLIALTGGIVQGMSGSPIIQDGKLVGAVTHVLVNDSTRGYGIFIETMLDAAE